MPQRMSKVCEETLEKENSPSHTDIADVGSLATKISDTPPNYERKTAIIELAVACVACDPSSSPSCDRYDRLEHLPAVYRRQALQWTAVSS